MNLNYVIALSPSCCVRKAREEIFRYPSCGHTAQEP